MHLIALIKTELLYKKAQEEDVPYFKYYSWIESTIQKEVLNQLYKKKKETGGKKPATKKKTTTKKAAATKKEP